VRLKQFQKAIDDFTTIITRNPEDEDSLRSRGDIYFEIGDYKHALRGYTESIRQMDDVAVTYNLRAKTYLKLGNKDAATRDFATAKELGYIDRSKPK
jgi:tetratricopeptide (TPR) repeat protein